MLDTMNTSNKESEMKQGDKVRIIASIEDLKSHGIDINRLNLDVYTSEKVGSMILLEEVGYLFSAEMLEVKGDENV